jgi:hypothetical protein
MSGMLSETWILPDFEPMEFIPATVRLTVYDSGQVRSPVSVFQEFIEAPRGKPRGTVLCEANLRSKYYPNCAR